MHHAARLVADRLIPQLVGLSHQRRPLAGEPGRPVLEHPVHHGEVSLRAVRGRLVALSIEVQLGGGDLLADEELVGVSGCAR